VPDAPAELSSLATALSDLTRRIAALAERAAASHDDETAGELFAVERSLTAAGRRVERLVAGSRRSR
jgi:hypothetical protein